MQFILSKFEIQRKDFLFLNIFIDFLSYQNKHKTYCYDKPGACSLQKILGPQLQNWMHFQILLLQRSFTEYFGTTATKLNALSNYTIKGHLQKLCDHKYKIRCNFFFLISLVESHLKYCISGWPAERLLALPGPFTSDRSLF